MRKDIVPPRPKDMMESLTPEQRQAIFQKAKQVEKSAQQIQQEKQVQTKRRNQALASSMMFSGDADDIIPGISNKQVKTLGQEKQEQAVQQKKLVKRTAQGTVKKAITTEYGTFDYEASPEESKILELGGQEANDLLVKIANYYRDEFKKQNVPIKESRKGFADLWEAGLNPESVDVQGQLRTNLKETFAPYTPLLPRLALEKVAGALGSKGQELLQSENMAAKGAGLVTSIGGSIAEDLSNPLATFAYDTGNLYDPTATAEERGGAAFNVVTKYALPAIAPLGAAQAGIKAFKAGQTVEQALTTASRTLLRSSLGALGKKIDTAVYSKVPLNKLLDVLEAEGQMMGKTRAALSKELATAGKKYAKETGKGVDEFYTKYLNDYADGKAQLTSPGRVPPPIIEPAKAPEAPTQVEDLGTVVDDLAGKTEPVVAEPIASVVEPPIAQNPDVGIYKISADKADEIDLQYGDDLQQAYVNKYPDATDAELTDIQNNDFREWKKQNPNASLESFYEEQIPKLDPYWQPAIHPKVKLPATPDAIRQIQNIAPSEKAISKLEDLPKEAKAIEQWTENNLLGELLPSDPNFDVRKADAVGQHYRIGNFPRDTSFDEWYEDLKNAIETQSQNRVLDELTDTSWLEDARNELYRIIYGSKDKSTNPFGKQWIQNNPERIIQLRIYDKRANKSLIPTRATKRFVSLEQIPAFMREDLLGRVRDDDFVYMTAADYARWKREGASAFGGTIKPRRMSDYANYKGDFYDDAQGLDEVMVPLEVVKEKYAELNAAYKKSKEGDKFAKYTPTKKDLERAFDNYFDVNQPIAPAVEPPVTPPTSIVDEIEQGMGASKSTAPPPPIEPTVTGIPETPDEQLTSAKNRMTQEVRDEYDMGGFDEPTRRAWEESLTTAKQELQSNANAVDNVIAKVESKQAINEAEQSVLVVALSRERRNARILLEQTIEATSPEEIARLTEQTMIAEDRVDNYTNALNRGGKETARTLNARRAVIDAAEDVISIRAKARQTYGKTLEVADEEEITKIGKELEDINKQIDDATGKGTTPVETVKANTRVKGIKESAPKLQPKADDKRIKQFESVVNRVKEKLDAFARPSTIETMGVPTEVDIWQPRLNDPASQAYFKQLASVQNDMGKVIQKLVTDEAIEDFDTLLARLQADGFNITDTDLKLILSADYPTTKLYDFSDIEKEYVKMVRRQLEQEAKGSSVAERGRLIKKIQDLSQKVQAGVRKVTDKTVKTVFEENIDLQNRLDDLQAQYEGYANQLDKVSQQERAIIQRQIDKIKEQIADPVLVNRIKEEVPQNVQDLVHEREILRGELNDKLRELADKKFREEHPYLNALEVAAKVPTELLTTLDNSAVFAHGAFLFKRNPLIWTKATGKSFQALISDGKYKDILASVRTSSTYDDKVRAGVAGIKQRDLQDATMYASVLQKVPYIGTLFKRSNAAMEVFGAVIRSDYFDKLTEASRKEYLQGKITRSELLDRYKFQAELVNTVTGKGIKELPRPVSVVAPFLNFGISRVKTATMTPFFNAIAKGDKVAARQFATEYFKYVSYYMGTLKVAQMFGLEVGIDPRDPEYFGKIKLPGIDKWWDMSGGILEPYRILVNWKPVRNITGAEESKFKTVGDFATGKLGAPAKTAMNVFQGMTGETPYGRNYDVRTDEGRLNVLMDNLPINVKTGKEVVESDKSLGAKAAESGLQFMGARLTKDKGNKARQPVTPGVIP